MAMNFASAVNLVALLLLIRAIMKDRNVLKGFSVSGTFLTFVAIFGFQIGFYLMGNHISFGIGIINLIFWLMAFIFSWKNSLREKQELGE
jgi:hypothetical protein